MTFRPVHHNYRLVFFAPCSYYKCIWFTKSNESQARVNISKTVTDKAAGFNTGQVRFNEINEVAKLLMITDNSDVILYEQYTQPLRTTSPKAQGTL